MTAGFIVTAENRSSRNCRGLPLLGIAPHRLRAIPLRVTDRIWQQTIVSEWPTIR
jgi:hypothetical protein